MRIISRKHSVLGVAVVGGACTVAAAAALAQSGGQPSMPPITQGASPPEVQTVSAPMKSHFGIMRRPQNVTDLLTGYAEKHVADGLHVGENAQLARRAWVRPDGEALFVVPGNGAICLVTSSSTGSSASCDTPDGAAAGHLIATNRARHGNGPILVNVHGMVPDGVNDVSVVLASGEEVKGSVTGDTYSVDVDGVPKDLVFNASDGRHSLPIPFAE